MLNTFKGTLNRIVRTSLSQSGITAISCSLKRADSRAVSHSSRVIIKNIRADSRGRNDAALRCKVAPLNATFTRLLSTEAKADGDSTKQNSQEPKNAENKGEGAGDSTAGNKGTQEVDYVAKIADLEGQLKAKSELAAKLTEENKELKNR